MPTSYGQSPYGSSTPYQSPAPSPFTNLNKTILSNGIYDDVQLVGRNLTDAELLSIAQNGTMSVVDLDTVFYASFNNTLEAGDLELDGITIESWKVTKKFAEDTEYKLVGIYPKTKDQFMSCEDLTAVANKETIYRVSPVGSNGVEGLPITCVSTIKFDGWWLIDPDNSANCVNFLYNLDDSNIKIEEGRTEINTFAKYPKVYYLGDKFFKRGSLSCLFVPDENYSAKEQVDTLISIIKQRKPLILKDGRGRNYLVDVSSPEELVITRPVDFSKITINWVEVGEV